MAGIVPRNNKEILHPEEAAASKIDLAQERLEFDKLKAQMAFQAQQANAEQRNMSMLLRAMGSPSGNASWIGHTAMPQQPTFAPRQGMFSGILSDPWHQYLAQKEYEVRRDRAIANQMDELYRRDSNDRFDQLLALMQAQKAESPANPAISPVQQQQQQQSSTNPENTQEEDPRDYALKKFRQTLIQSYKDGSNVDVAMNLFNAKMRSDKHFAELLANSNKYDTESKNRMMNDALLEIVGLDDKSREALNDPNLSKVNLIHPYGLALIDQSKGFIKDGEPIAQVVHGILRGVGSQSINNDLKESVYRPLLQKIGLGTSQEIPVPELQLAASLYNYMKNNGISDDDINYFKDPNNNGFESKLSNGLGFFKNRHETDIENAIPYLKQLDFNQIKNREIYDKLAAQTQNAFINASRAYGLAKAGHLTEAEAKDFYDEYNRLTRINPAQYENMLQLVNDKKNIPMDARSLIPKYTKGSAVYPDLNARLRDPANILNSKEMQNYLSDTNNFRKFLMSSYYYGKDYSNPAVKASVDSVMNEYYKARTPKSRDLPSVVKNIKTRLNDTSTKDNISTYTNKPDDNGSLYVDLLAKAEGYRDNIFKDSGGKGVYLLSVTNSGKWYVSNAKIGTKFSDLSQADQNAAYDNQANALSSKWKTTTDNLHDPNVWKYVKELKHLNKSDIDDITALLASSCYRGDSVSKGTLINTFNYLMGDYLKIKGKTKSDITPEDVYNAYTDVLIANYSKKSNGDNTNVRVVRSRRDNIINAYNKHKQNKAK